MSKLIVSAIVAKLKEVAKENAATTDTNKSDQLKKIEDAVLAYHRVVNNDAQSNAVQVPLCTLMGEPYKPLFGTGRYIPQWTVVKVKGNAGGADAPDGSILVVLGGNNNYAYDIKTRKVWAFQTKDLYPVTPEEAAAAIEVIEKDDNFYQWFTTNIGLAHLSTL